MVQPVSRRRTLGDKLFFLGQLSREDLAQIERLVDYRIKTLIDEEFARIQAASKGPRLVHRR